MITAVFFPSLMGVGILISGALLISDWIRRLFPQSHMRREHNVVVGTYGAVADAVDAAGYRLQEPWFLGRGLRKRSTYLVWAGLLALAAAGSIWAGIEFYRDPLGLFYESPWAVGLGYGFGAAFVVAALLCLIIGTSYRSTPRLLMKLVTDTSMGRIILPTDEDHETALNNIEREV